MSPRMASEKISRLAPVTSEAAKPSVSKEEPLSRIASAMSWASAPSGGGVPTPAPAPMAQYMAE